MLHKFSYSVGERTTYVPTISQEIKIPLKKKKSKRPKSYKLNEKSE